MVGTLYLAPCPSSTYLAQYYTIVTGSFPIEDFDAGTDNPDFPSYWYNALAWGLADAMSWEAGLPLAERSMLEKKADKHKAMAMSLDQEEGSMRFGPNSQGY